MNPPTREFDTLIVGGGLAGLTAAARLAKGGQRVLVLEASRSLGGRARTRRIDGRAFNFGPHALYRAGRAHAILAELGVEPKGAVPPVSGGLAFARGASHSLPVGLVSLLTTGLFGLTAKFEVARFLAGLARTRPDAVNGQTVAQWLDGLALGTEARHLIEALVRLTSYVHAPGEMSAQVALLQLQLASAGSVSYLHGGWQPMVDALAEVAREAGAEIITGTRVAGLRAAEGGYVVGLAEADAVSARAVVLAIGPRPAASLLRGLGLEADWADGLRPVRASCLDVALEALPRPDAIFGLGIDEPTYVSVHSATADLGPGHVVHVARYLAPGEAPATREDLEAVLDRLQPGFTGAAVHVEYHPKMVVSHALPRPGPLDLRPAPDDYAGVGVLLAGEWLQSDGWLADAACASADAAARAILRAYRARAA